jgi:hypothetical protein
VFVRISDLIGHAFFAVPCDSQILYEKLKQRALYTIIMFAICFWSGLMNWTAGPQSAYFKMSTAAQSDRWYKPAFPGLGHALKARRLMGS